MEQARKSRSISRPSQSLRDDGKARAERAAEMTITKCARLLERSAIMRAPVISEGKVFGIVSFHDLMLRGPLELIKEQ